MYTKPVQKWAHVLLTAFGAAYLTFVLPTKGFINAFTWSQTEQVRLPVFFYLACAGIIFCLFYAGLHAWVSRSTALFEHNQIKRQLSPALFLAVAAAVFALYLSYLAAYYPGGFSPDTSMQWYQAHSMQFDDHHPFFHTFFFWLLTRIWDNYTFMLLVQITAFACALGYLAATMHAWGFKRSVVFTLTAVIAIATPTRNIVLYFWKDTALSIFFLFFLSHIFNIVLTNGEWLKKPSHWTASAVLLACITLVRHNAILLTAPMLVLMIIYLSGARRACLKLTALVLLIVLGIKGPLYSIYNVDASNDSYLETTGLPMTILFSSYVFSPETMPEEAYQFLERLEPHDSAVQKYEFGNYNSVKWSWGMDYGQTQQKLEGTSVADLLKMTLQTIKGNATLALRSVLELTDMVWDPVGTHYHLQDIPGGAPPSYVSIPTQIRQLCSGFFKIVDSALDGPIFQKLTSQLGVLILIMLLACYVSIHHFRGWSSLWIILPIMCYNFGTMLLLCGPDYRFFHFNCLAAYPLVILLLSRPRDAENETCK